ncbi:hypothetical protein E4U38_005402 [Claviceps purpurea]|nr:hypothetical protein E4U38_005402 [Claviceps purpurea]
MCAEQIKKDTKPPRVDGVRGSDQSRGDEGSNETKDGEAKTRTGQDRGLSLDEASGCPAIRRAGLTAHATCLVSQVPIQVHGKMGNKSIETAKRCGWLSRFPRKTRDRVD